RPTPNNTHLPYTTLFRSEEQKHKKTFNKGEQHLDEETLFVISQTFKALSDPTRIRILNLLCLEEHSVNDIAEKLNLSQSSVSHQDRKSTRLNSSHVSISY